MVPHLGFKTLWFPILQSLIPTLFPANSTLYLAMDRTHWRLTNHTIVILGDREFCSIKLRNWLQEEAVGFALRLKKNLMKVGLF